MKNKPSIPKDWTIHSFGEIFEFLPTLTLSRVDLDSDESASGIYNLHYGDIHSTYNYTILDFEIEKRIPKVINDELDESKLTFLVDGDIVIADASEDYEGVGTCIELKNIDKRKVTAGLHTFAARQKKQIFSNGFKGYLFKHPWVRNELKKLATGSKVFGVSKTNVAELKIVFPPFKEQQKIAAILSKWDEAIEAQTQLIAAKETQKKALMQKLLTGEVRFPGFEEEWEEVTLGDISRKIGDGLHGTPKYVEESEYYFVNGNNLENGKIVFNENTKYISESEYLKHKKDIDHSTILISINGTIGKIAKYKGEKIVLGKSAAYLSFKRENFDFLFFILQSEFIKNFFESELTGSTIRNLSLKTIRETSFKLPSDLEQTKIASVLSSIDLEIAALKNELEALNIQKKGLMQELLTGKIRVRV